MAAEWVALAAARETLELVIAQNQAQLDYHQQQVEHLQQTIFVVFDDLLPAAVAAAKQQDNSIIMSMVAIDESLSSYAAGGMSSRDQRAFLFRQQQRHEAKASAFKERVEDLKGELTGVMLAAASVDARGR